MFSKKIISMIFLLVIVLVLTGCGQLSVGLVTPASGGASEVGPGAGEVVEEVESATPESVVVDEPTAEPQVEAESYAIPDLAFVGTDGNLWLLEAGSESPRQLTADANPIGGEGTAIGYESPHLSSDGALLAFNRNVSTPSGNEGYETAPAVWVMDLQTGEMTQLHEGFSAGMAWKPGTHLLAFGLGVDIEYFMSRGEPDPALANGIRGVDLDTGETMELVAPERGFTLAAPQWSSDGRFLAFAEVFGMEGSGLFAYYDFVSEQYTAWEEPIGWFSWSPNGGLLTYALQLYTATGEERLYLREREGAEQEIGPDYDGPAYATYPVFSPDGSRIAFLAFLEGPETNIATVSILDLASGETQSFGQYEGTWELDWTPDGSHLVFFSGTWEDFKIIAINVSDGSEILLAEGAQPTLAGR